MWRLLGRVAATSFRAKRSRLATVVGLGASLAYLTYNHSYSYLLQTHTGSTPLACETNTLKVPSNLPEEQIQYIREVFPEFQIQVSSKLDQEMYCINAFGECKQIKVKDILIDKNWIYHLTNFIIPPHQVNEERFNKVIHNMTSNQVVILRYIPQNREESEQAQIHKEYRQLKYQSTSTNNTYLIIRDPSLANKLQLTQDSIHILRPKPLDSKQQDKLPRPSITHNTQIFYTNSIPASSNPQSLKQFIISNTLQDINIVYSDNQLDNFIRTVQNSPSKLVLTIGLDKVSGKDFEEVKQAFKKFKRDIYDDIHILINKNKGLLKRRLSVEEDPMTIETRIIDLAHHQAPKNIFEGYKLQGFQLKKGSSILSRRKYEESLDKNEFKKFLNEKKDQYYENKELKNIQPITKLSKDLKGVVLIYKNECHGCMLVSRVLENVQQVVEELKREGPSAEEYIKSNNIACPDKFKEVKIYRYHILNEDSEYPLQVNYTPQIHFFSEKGDRLIKLKDEARIKDVHLSIVKDICDELA